MRCAATDCRTTCHAPVTFDDLPEVCECIVELTPDGHTSCELPEPCQGDDVCQVQAVRYGIPGRYSFDGDSVVLGVDDGHVVEIEVLGPGRARAHEYGWTHDCCDDQVNEFGTYYHPQAVRAVDDPAWAECLEAGDAASCLDPLDLFVGACEMPLSRCPTLPEPPGPDAPCDESCPMAGDGICDEAAGTGLCPAGCDPVDCA